MSVDVRSVQIKYPPLRNKCLKQDGYSGSGFQCSSLVHKMNDNAASARLEYSCRRACISFTWAVIASCSPSRCKAHLLAARRFSCYSAEALVCMCISFSCAFISCSSFLNSYLLRFSRRLYSPFCH